MQIPSRLVEAAGGLSLHMVEVDDDAQVPDNIEVECGERDGKKRVRVFTFDSTMVGMSGAGMDRIPVYVEDHDEWR